MGGLGGRSGKRGILLTKIQSQNRQNQKARKWSTVRKYFLKPCSISILVGNWYVFITENELNPSLSDNREFCQRYVYLLNKIIKIFKNKYHDAE